MLLALPLLLGLGWGVWFLWPGPESWLREGQRALERNDLTRAEFLAARLEINNYRDQALLLRGELQLQLGQPSQALMLLNQIVGQSDVRLQAVALAGRCLLQLGDLLEAERTFSYLLSQRSEDVAAHRGLAAVYYDLGALALAGRHCEEWARLEPMDGRPPRLMGLISKDLGHFQQAVEHYESALARNLKHHVKDEVRLEQAECWLRLREYHKALGVLDGVGPESAGVAQARVSRAEALRGLGRGPEALGLAEKAVAADPRNAAALRLQGQLLLEADQAREALPLLEQAAALAPEDYLAHHLLAQAYARSGRTREAAAKQLQVKQLQNTMDELTKLTQSVMASPKDAALHLRMAECYEQLALPAMAARHRRIASQLTSTSRS